MSPKSAGRSHRLTTDADPQRLPRRDDRRSAGPAARRCPSRSLHPIDRTKTHWRTPERSPHAAGREPLELRRERRTEVQADQGSAWESGKFPDELRDMAKQWNRDRLLLGAEGFPRRR